jgi:hypothetical protein
MNVRKYLQGSRCEREILDHPTLGGEGIISRKTLGHATPSTQHHFQEDLSPQHNNCGNLKSRVTAASCTTCTVTPVSLYFGYLHTTVLCALWKLNRQQKLIRTTAGITRAVLYRITEQILCTSPFWQIFILTSYLLWTTCQSFIQMHTHIL